MNLVDRGERKGIYFLLTRDTGEKKSSQEGAAPESF